MTAAAGHNSTLSASEHRALHFHHFNAIQAQQAKVKAEQDALKKLRKQAKADGCMMADLDYMARCADLEDPSIVPEELQRRAEIASWFALPVNFQPDMFTDRTPLEDRAFEEGKVAGLRGKDPKPAYDENGVAGQAWIKGWHEGQKTMREDLQAAMEKNNAAAAKKVKAPKNAKPDDDGAFPDADTMH